jgi:hypothetical protein
LRVTSASFPNLRAVDQCALHGRLQLDGYGRGLDSHLLLDIANVEAEIDRQLIVYI